MSKAFAFKQQCVKSDEELRKEQLDLVQHQVEEDIVYVKNTEEPTEEAIPDNDGYTYHLVEEYERIDEEEYPEEKNVQFILKVERRDELNDSHNDSVSEQCYNIEMSEVEEPTTEEVNDQEIIQEEVFEYEIENDTSNQAAKGDSDEELDIIPKMVFRKYNKRNKKMPTPPYTCTVCSKVLSNYSSFKYHMQLHSDKKVKLLIYITFVESFYS